MPERSRFEQWLLDEYDQKAKNAWIPYMQKLHPGWQVWEDLIYRHDVVVEHPITLERTYYELEIYKDWGEWPFPWDDCRVCYWRRKRKV